MSNPADDQILDALGYPAHTNCTCPLCMPDKPRFSAAASSDPTFLASSNEHCPVNIVGVGKFMAEGKEAHVLIYTKYGEKRNVRIDKPTYFLLRDIFRSLSEDDLLSERLLSHGRFSENVQEEPSGNCEMVEEETRF